MRQMQRLVTSTNAAISISPLPLFKDNYAYIVRNEVSRRLVLVDPADAGACLAAARAEAAAGGYVFAGVLTTHHHADHSGGNVELAAAVPGLVIVGGAAESGRVPAATRLVADGEEVELGGLAFTALHTPCHTAGHICYYLAAAGAVFTGDTLFAGGCGRFFEGGAAVMAASLAKLAALPPATAVLCGHEYTVANLEFCLSVEPGNAATVARLVEARRLRAAGLPAVGAGTLADELATNVFLRAGEPAVARGVGAAAGTSALDVLALLRETKNAR